MKALKLIAGCVIIAGWVACKSGNEASTAKAPEKKKKENTAAVSHSSDTPANARLIVSFISIGEGADFRAKDSMEVYMTRFQEETKKTVKYESIPWGREGEMDYCFNLNELTEKEQKKFIEGIRATVKFSELVQISENQPCRQRR